MTWRYDTHMALARWESTRTSAPACHECGKPCCGDTTWLRDGKEVYVCCGTGDCVDNHKQHDACTECAEERR
jgi:hypothetical protein